MAKTIRLKESDLKKIISKILLESDMMDVSSDSEYYKQRERKVSIPFNDLSTITNMAKRFCEGKENFPDCQTVNRIYSDYQLFM